ncbi:SPOR domain-containing protein [Aquimarina brevivitae]|uniref:Sporulation related protein n=1 Tax=Aquimarina brevivitae TaxID=323412 RepID=A0A4Q7PFH4_9FLAO|nr:SPOR domain-containing protein [Aquimarina brevivitae]RZS99243.1 sporulation related protein [Aquimarina brevivitae]
MNNTAQYISDLLYRYECVIIPGFGAFLTRRQPATIISETNSFYPPKKLISFNSQLQNNDGLLANHIASVEHISYTDAVAKVQRFVLYLQNTIQSGARLQLDGIGAFYTSTENTLQFEPIAENSYLTEAFGMSSFNSPKIKREVYKETVEEIEDKTPVSFTPEKRKEPWTIRYAGAAAIVFLIGIGGAIGYQLYKGDVESHNYMVRQDAAKDIDKRIQEATFEISNPLPTINLALGKADSNTPEVVKEEKEAATVSTSSPGKYHIIAGAFRIKANANKKVKQLQQKGFTHSKVIGVNKYGLHQVVYTSFVDRISAIEALKTIKSNEDRRAWMYVE